MIGRQTTLAAGILLLASGSTPGICPGGVRAAPLRGIAAGDTDAVLARVDDVLEKELDILAREEADGGSGVRFQSGVELCQGKEGFQKLSGADGHRPPNPLALEGDGSGFDVANPGNDKFVLWCPKAATTGTYITGTAFSDVFPGQSVVSKFVSDRKIPGGTCPDKINVFNANKCCVNDDHTGLILGNNHHTFVASVKAGCPVLFRMKIKQGNLGKRWDWSNVELLQGADDTEYNFNIKLFGQERAREINEAKGLTAVPPAAPEESRCAGVPSADEGGTTDHAANPTACNEVSSNDQEPDVSSDGGGEGAQVAGDGDNAATGSGSETKMYDDVPIPTGDDQERVDDPEPTAAAMTRRGNGFDKVFYCCAQKTGGEFGFLQTKQAVMDRELNAMAALAENGIPAEYLMVTHRTTEGGEWSMPTDLKGKDGEPVTAESGYWVKRSDILVDFKPIMSALMCQRKVSRAAARVENKAAVATALTAIKEKLPTICAHAGEVTVYIETDGTVKLSDVAPNGARGVCTDQVAQIQKGLDKCLTAFQ